MKTTELPETKLRRFVDKQMPTDEWAFTWHEDREITPGVPDLHYVMKTGRAKVGWLELKAIDKPLGRSRRIKVEPSQHQYFRRWASLMPIHFLVRIVDHIYIVPGAYHTELHQAICAVDMLLLSVLDFHESELAEKLPTFLRDITRI